MKISDAPANLQPLVKTPHADGIKADSQQQPVKIDLSPGQLLKGLVTGITEDGKVQLNVAGQTLTARSLVTLTEGKELWFEVSRGGSLPLLNLAGKKGAVQDFLKLFLSINQLSLSGQKQLFSEISALFSDNQNLSSQNKTLLATMIAATQGKEASPQAVRVLTALLGTNPDGIPAQKADLSTLPLYSNVKQTITAHQEINFQPPQQDNQNFYLFPCFFAEQNGWGEWLFSLERQEPSSAERYSLSFFLEMTNLGPMAIMATITDKTIRGEFSLQTERARSHLASSLDSLAASLKNQGYTAVHFSCSINKKEFIQQFKETLEKKTSTARFTLVDITV